MEHLEIYTILDRVAGIGSIMTSPVNTEKAMIRAFADVVMQQPSIRNHAEDYVLVKLGKINKLTGEIEENYEEIYEASNFVQTPNTKGGEQKDGQV